MLSQEHLYHFHTGRRRQSNLPDPLGPLARVSPRSSPGSWHCRSRKNSDFSARLNYHEFQVIPTAWIEAAQERWRENGPCGPMTAIGVDVAQGGDDRTVVAARHGGWYARLVRKLGKETREGSDVARAVVGVTTVRSSSMSAAAGAPRRSARSNATAYRWSHSTASTRPPPPLARAA
jgi:hypothetical protein